MHFFMHFLPNKLLFYSSEQPAIYFQLIRVFFLLNLHNFKDNLNRIVCVQTNLFQGTNIKKELMLNLISIYT